MQRCDEINWNQLPKLPKANCATCPLRESKQVHFVFPNNPDHKKYNFKKPDPKFEIPDYENIVPHTHAFMGMHGGAEEVKIGEVLVGPSGKVVRQTSEQLEIINPALINAVACAPDYDENVNEIARQKCEPAIHEIIKKLNPKLLFAMGPEALRTSGILPSPQSTSVEKKFKITKANGLIEHSEKLGNIPVMQLIHPAFFLRSTDDGKGFGDSFGDWTDAIYYGNKNLQNPIPRPKVKLVKTVDQLKEIIGGITQGEIVAVDIETKSLKLFEQILTIQITHEKDPYTGYVIPIPQDIRPIFKPEKWKWEVELPDNPIRHELYNTLKNFLESPDYKFLAHGGMFDVPYLLGYGIHIILSYDSLLLTHVLNENAFSLGLKQQARMRLSWPEWDKKLYEAMGGADEDKQLEQIRKGVKKIADWSKIPKHKLYRYAGWDTPATLLTYLALKSDSALSEDEFDMFVEEIMPTLNMFIYLRFTGVQIDVPRLIELNELYNHDSRLLLDEIHDIALDYGLLAFNPNSSQQLAVLLFDKMEMPEIEGRSTNRKSVLERLPINPIIPKIIEFKEHRKEQTSYVKGVAKFLYPDMAIHPYYNLVLKTSRMSATDPSVLNIKKGSKVRDIYIPHQTGEREEYFVFEGDQSQCELRVLTGATKSKQMLQAFKVGFEVVMPDGTLGRSKDIHGYFSKLINPSLSLEEIEKGGYRTRTKNVVFGKVYRASVAVMAQQMLMSSLRELKRKDPEEFNEVTTSSAKFNDFYNRLLEQAQAISDKLDELCPELKEYERNCIAELHANAFVTSYTRRKRHFPLVTNNSRKHSENQAVNFPIQDTANAINWYAMRKVYEKYQKGYTNPPVRLWFSVHDSIVGAVKKSELNSILPDIQEIGEKAAGNLLGERHPIFLEVPFKVDMKLGTNFGNTKEIKEGDYNKAIEYAESLLVKENVAIRSKR